VPFFGQRQQRLGQQLELVDFDGQLGRLGAKKLALDADDVA
jgi:hypothetical protein